MVLAGVQARAQKAGQSFTQAFASKDAFLHAVRTDDDDVPLLVGNQRWSNKDLEPTVLGGYFVYKFVESFTDTI